MPETPKHTDTQNIQALGHTETHPRAPEDTSTGTPTSVGSPTGDLLRSDVLLLVSCGVFE